MVYKFTIICSILMGVVYAYPHNMRYEKADHMETHITEEAANVKAHETKGMIAPKERRSAKNFDWPNQKPQVAEGSYSYTAPDGRLYTITFMADKNRLRPLGDHLPTPPPIPPAIQRASASLA